MNGLVKLPLVKGVVDWGYVGAIWAFKSCSAPGPSKLYEPEAQIASILPIESAKVRNVPQANSTSTFRV